MHEMSILSNVIDVVLKYAQENNVREVVSVTLVVGELRDVVDKLMEHDKDDPEKMDAYLQDPNVQPAPAQPYQRRA